MLLTQEYMLQHITDRYMKHSFELSFIEFLLKFGNNKIFNR